MAINPNKVEVPMVQVTRIGENLFEPVYNEKGYVVGMKLIPTTKEEIRYERQGKLAPEITKSITVTEASIYTLGKLLGATPNVYCREGRMTKCIINTFGNVSPKTEKLIIRYLRQQGLILLVNIDQRHYFTVTEKFVDTVKELEDKFGSSN